MHSRYNFLSLPLLLGIFSCQDDFDIDEGSFLKIYDNNQANIDYHPVDVAETTTGFLILSGTASGQSDFQGIQLITTDESGDYFTETTLDNNLVSATSGLYLIDSSYYFFAMNRTTLRATLVSTSSTLDDVQTSNLTNLLYPLSSSMTSDGNFLLLSYDPVNLLTVLSLISPDGQVLNSSGFSIGVGQDLEQTIIDNYLEPVDKLPFFCGEMQAGQYYFNGFYNFSLSMVFTDLGNIPNGVIQGQSDDGGMRAAQWISGSEFAVVGFQFDNNYLDPSATLNTTGTTSSIDLFPSEQSELRSGTPAQIISYGEGLVVLAAETESREVALYFYSTTDGTLKGIETVGFLNPFTLGALHVDEEDNLYVLGTTFVSGRFERVFLRKIIAKDLTKYQG